MNPTRFVIANFILLAVLVAAYTLLVHSGKTDYNPVIPGLFLGFAVMNPFFLKMLITANARSPQRFVTAFIGVVGIKLMSAMVFLLVYLMLVDDAEVIFVTGALFIAYLSHTILLIRAALSQTNKQK
jgi:F0F1-type ATP synthase assembly protein I